MCCIILFAVCCIILFAVCIMSLVAAGLILFPVEGVFNSDVRSGIYVRDGCG